MKSTGFTVSHILNNVDDSSNNDLRTSRSGKELASSKTSDGIKVDIVLQEAELWRKFHSLVNEMIVTKNGRLVVISLYIRLCVKHLS